MINHLMELPSGNEIAYWTHHDRKKPTVVLVHGFTGSHDGFQYLVPLLKDFRLIIPDLPGFGVSPLPHQKLTLPELGKLLTEFIEALDLPEKPHLLGHSMGSLVVAEAACQRPQDFAKKLVLISPVPSPVRMVEKRRAGVLASRLYYGACHRLPSKVGKRLTTSRKLTKLSTRVIMTTKDEKLRKSIYNHHYDNLNYISNIGWYSRLYAAINRTGINRYRSTLQKFDVLIINGDNDSVTPLKHQRKAAKAIGARLKIVPEVGHLAHYEKPTELADAVRHFLHAG